MAFWPRNPKWTHQLPQPYHLEVLIDQNQTEGEQHPDGVDCVGWHDPDAAIRLQGPATKQANQPPQYGVCYLDSKGQGSPGLVIDKDVPLLFEHTWSFHEVGSLNLVRCFFLHPVYQREENDDCKHARSNRIQLKICDQTVLAPHPLRRISVGSVRRARSTAGSVAMSAVSRMAPVGKAIMSVSVALTW